MKKNFFKKLSFVLALAMVLSVIAPAAAAFAAAGPKLNSTKKYLHLGEADTNEYNFNIKNKKTGWKYAWESSNEDVVVVNEKNGVATATGVGTAKVTVFITDKNKEEVTDLTATVIVRDNIKSVSITNKPADDKLAVGVENDFNRSFVTVANSTKKTSSVTRWVVEPSEGATIADNGVFVATKAGKYTVTANSFQSKAKYNAWKADSVANAGLVLATDSYEFNVSATMVDAKQVDKDTVNVSFDSAMVDVDKNISVYQMVGTTKIKQTVAKVTLDDAKKVATVDLYIPFTAGATYVVDYTGMEGKSFVAATTNAEDVASMQVTTTTAVVNVEKAVEVKLFNKDGVDITTDILLTRVTMKSAGEAQTFFNEGSKKVLIFGKGVTTAITATYHTYKYNTTTGVEEGNVTAAGVIIGVDADATNVTGLNAWTIVASSPNFGDVKQQLAADDYGNRLFVKLNTLTGTTTASVDSNANAGDFEFKSNDESVLIVDKTTGALHPVKEGVAVVVVSYGTGSTKTPVATVSISITAKKAASNFTLSAYEFSLSNTVAFHDTKKIELALKDQLGRDYNFDSYKIERVSAPLLSDGTFSPDNLIALGAGNSQVFNQTANAKAEVIFDAFGVDKGTYVYKITVKDIVRVVTITVLEPSSATVAYHKLAISTTAADMNVASWTGLPINVQINLFGYSANGVKVTDETLGGTYTVKVEAPWDASGNFVTIDSIATGSYTVVKTGSVAGISGSAILKAPVGSFKVSAFEGTKALDTVYFTTTDGQAKAVLAKVENQVLSTALTSADIANKTSSALIKNVEDAFDFKVDGSDVAVVEVEAVGTPDSIAVKSVKVRQVIKGSDATNDAVYLIHTVNVGLTLQKK